MIAQCAKDVLIASGTITACCEKECCVCNSYIGQSFLVTYLDETSEYDAAYINGLSRSFRDYVDNAVRDTIVAQVWDPKTS